MSAPAARTSRPRRGRGAAWAISLSLSADGRPPQTVRELRMAAAAATRAMARALHRPHGPLFHADCVFRIVVLNTLHDYLGFVAVIDLFLNIAQDRAASLCRAAERESLAAWRAHMQGGPAAGLRRQHRFTRCPSGWIPTKVGKPPVLLPNDVTGGELEAEGISEHDLRRAEVQHAGVMRPLNAQELVESEANDWGEQWAEGVDCAELVWPSDLGDQLGLPTPAEMRRAMMSFPPETGLGWDAWHPRAWTRLSDSMIMALARILAAAEVAGRWPAAIG